MERKKIAAANWKMNTTLEEGMALLENLCARSFDDSVEVVICAPATHLYALSQMDIPESLSIGAQNMSEKQQGAYTGEISAEMVVSVGCDYVIIGHSERRGYFGEDAELLRKKLVTALEHHLTPIFCCGEALEIRKEGAHVDYVVNQIKQSFEGLTAVEMVQIVIAYEPIWAIGTGETASPEQAQEMHQAIRAFLAEEYGEKVAQSVPILYGGSVKPGNAKEIFGKPDVDGGLVGGASLKDESFAQIIISF